MANRSIWQGVPQFYTISNIFYERRQLSSMDTLDKASLTVLFAPAIKWAIMLALMLCKTSCNSNSYYRTEAVGEKFLLMACITPVLSVNNLIQWPYIRWGIDFTDSITALNSQTVEPASCSSFDNKPLARIGLPNLCFSSFSPSCGFSFLLLRSC